MQVLTAAGVGELAAQAWITAVCSRRCTATVTVAGNLGAGPDGSFEVSEVRWLVAGAGERPTPLLQGAVRRCRERLVHANLGDDVRRSVQAVRRGIGE